MGRRPNTIPPDQVTFVSLSMAQLLGMSDLQLVDFANRTLGIPTPKGTSRNTTLTRIVNSAISTRD